MVHSANREVRVERLPFRCESDRYQRIFDFCLQVLELLDFTIQANPQDTCAICAWKHSGLAQGQTKGSLLRSGMFHGVGNLRHLRNFDVSEEFQCQVDSFGTHKAQIADLLLAQGFDCRSDVRFSVVAEFDCDESAYGVFSVVAQFQCSSPSSCYGRGLGPETPSSICQASTRTVTMSML